MINNFNSAGRKIFQKSDLTLALERRPEIETYMKELLKLEPKVSQSSLVTSFFHRRPNDPECFNQFPLQLNTMVEPCISELPDIAFKPNVHQTDEVPTGLINESFVESGNGSQVMLENLELNQV